MTESRKIVLIWFFFTFMNVIFLLLEDFFELNNKDLNQQLGSVFDLIGFSSTIIRNLLCALIAFYYSIFLPNREYNKTKVDEKISLGIIGTLAIDDFDTAMKSFPSV